MFPDTAIRNSKPAHYTSAKAHGSSQNQAYASFLPNFENITQPKEVFLVLPSAGLDKAYVPLYMKELEAVRLPEAFQRRCATGILVQKTGHRCRATSARGQRTCHRCREKCVQIQKTCHRYRATGVQIQKMCRRRRITITRGVLNGGSNKKGPLRGLGSIGGTRIKGNRKGFSKGGPDSEDVSQRSCHKH